MEHQDLISYLSQYGHFERELLDRICQKFSLKKICNRDHFLHAGDIANKLFFINCNCVRYYYIADDGKDVTVDFNTGPAFFTSVQSFYSRKPSDIFIQAMNNMDYYELNYLDYYELCSSIEEMIRISESVMREAYISSQSRIKILLQANPVEKYHWLLSNYRYLINNVPLQYIASFLGITPETISRVRRQINYIS